MAALDRAGQIAGQPELERLASVELNERHKALKLMEKAKNCG
jgi:hypothetical protein